MNYTIIHDKFIDYCKNTTIKERLSKRNADDFRLNKEYIYTEHHHILPKSQGGSDDDSNLVELLPEEHLFIHKLRYKAFCNRTDMLSVRFILNGLNNASEGNRKIDSRSIRVNKEIRKTFSFIKQHSAEFRKIHGWQTIEGVKRISESRKGTFTMKDINTGEIVGSFSKTHPKYISGEWVHHSKGMVAVRDIDGNNLYIESEVYQKNKDLYNVRLDNRKGRCNSRFIDISTEEIINLFNDFCIKHGIIMKYDIFFEVSKQIDSFKKVPSIKNNYRKQQLNGKIEDIISKMNPMLPYMVKKYYSKEDKKYI